MTSEWSVSKDAYLKHFNSPADQLRRELLDPLISLLIDPAGKSVLDVGCGEGYFCRKLRQRGAKRVLGFDVVPELIEIAKKKDHQSHYIVGSIYEILPYETEKFDLAFANMVLMDLPDLSRAFDVISKSLTPEGIFIATVVNPHYAFPVGVWKRDLRKFLIGDFAPQLQITNYFTSKEVKKNLQSKAFYHHHWRMSEYVNEAFRAGLFLTKYLEPQITEELRKKYSNLFLSRQLTKVPLFSGFRYDKKDINKI